MKQITQFFKNTNWNDILCVYIVKVEFNFYYISIILFFKSDVNIMMF